MRRSRGLALVVLAVLLACAGCAMAPAETPRCALGTKPMLAAELFFGRNEGGAFGVTDRDWAGFVGDTLGRRFPGFTVTDAAGQWRDDHAQTIESERTKLVIVALDDTPASLDAIAAVIAGYKLRFHQQAVGLLLDRRCGDFGG